MIIGNGLLAKEFESYKKDKEVLIFASGVSNSTETDSNEFSREFDLIKQTIHDFPKVKIVYFSTLSIEDLSVHNRPYIKHKLKIEAYLKKHSISFLIFRVSNVVGNLGNKNTIVNYFVNAIKENQSFCVWKNAERNLIDVSDLFQLSDLIIKNNSIENRVINIATRKSVKVSEIVTQIELYLKLKANAVYENKGTELNIDVSEIYEELLKIEEKKGVGETYVNYLLQKYY